MKSQESIQKQIRSRKENFYKKLCSNKYVKPLFNINELDTTDYSKIYKWQCLKCGHIFKSKLNHLFFSRKKIAYARCLKCFPIDKHNSKLRFQKYGNNMGDIKKMLNTKQKKYGLHYEKVGEKISKTKQQFSQKRWDQINERRKVTCKNKYGVESYSQTDQFKKQIIAQSQSKYNVDSPNQVPSVRLKQQKRYIYNGIGFDSKGEIAFYIWLVDHNFVFNYSKNIKEISYVYNNKIHKYFPDFEIIFNGHSTLIELKGTHFFKSDGTMYCPYRNPKWTDEIYKSICGRIEAKHQCMLLNNVKIIKSDSTFMKKLFRYITKKYGCMFLKQFKRDKS